MIYIGLSLKALLRAYLLTKVQILKYNIKYIWLKPHVFNKIKPLKNSKKGSSAFVFANGPSLIKLNAEKVNKYILQGFDLFGVNSYITSTFAKTAPPTHYILSDPAHFGKMQNLLTPKRIVEVKRDLEKIIAANIPLFCPLEYVGLAYHNLYPFNESENLFSSNVSDVTKPRGYLSMTAYKALAIACYMGYSRIYVCGFDNDYFKSIIVNASNELYYTDSHFSDSEENRIKANEGHPARELLHKVNHQLEANSVGALLYSHHFLFKHLEKFNKYKIFNLDRDSLVDAFSKYHNLDVY